MTPRSGGSPPGPSKVTPRPAITADVWEARYRRDYEPTTADLHRRAVELTEAVVRWEEAVHAV